MSKSTVTHRDATSARSFATTVALIAAAAFAGTGSAMAQQRPPVRQLGKAVATSAPLGAVAAVRPLSNGNVLVNDPANRQVLLLDSTMKLIRVVADTTSATQKAYGTRGGGLVAYHGDSTLFVDPASYSMLVLDPDGKIIRVIAAPRPGDVSALLGGPQGGNAGFDSNGKLVYRNLVNMPPPTPVKPGEQAPPPQAADTAPIVRFDLKTRTIDTVAFTKVEATKRVWIQTANGERIAPVINPLQLVDDWALLPDGTVAIVRKNYHVDFIAPDGTEKSGPIMPFDWKRLTDSAKSALIDSVKAERNGRRGRRVGPVAVRSDSSSHDSTATRDSANATRDTTAARETAQRPERDAAGGGRGGFRGGRGGGGGFRGGRGGGVVVIAGADGAAGGPVALGAGGRAAGGLTTQYVAPSALPDYEPAFATGAVHADEQGHIWVRIITSDTTTAGPIYDVIDRNGNLIDSVEVPLGTTIAAFGPDGAVYLGVRDQAGVHLVRASEK